MVVGVLPDKCSKIIDKLTPFPFRMEWDFVIVALEVYFAWGSNGMIIFLLVLVMCRGITGYDPSILRSGEWSLVGYFQTTLERIESGNEAWDNAPRSNLKRSLTVIQDLRC